VAGQEGLRKLVSGCVSCDILAGRRSEPGGVIYEDEYWHVGSVVRPVVWPGFLVVKLKRHCEQLSELTPAEAAALGPVLQVTCQALASVLNPAKVYVCSFGDGVKHIHFWILPRPLAMRPGMHWVMLNLDLRVMLARLGVKRWLVSDAELLSLAERVRSQIGQRLEG
jgi:diadenosine tetraphosphate (Ap4A) HIT family hydrolase